MKSPGRTVLLLFSLLPIAAFAADAPAVPPISSTESTGVVPRKANPSDLYDPGVMGPPTNAAIVAAAQADIKMPMAPGPFQPTWVSIEKDYRTPAWFVDAKFGIMMHWGVYSAAAHHNEWYEKHMYAADSAWHVENFGPQEVAGYKNLIPLFTAAKWDPAAWAALFRKAGARYVILTAQHHDNFALWDSAVAPVNAKTMGPKRDLVGDLGKAVRAENLKFGVSNHGIENFTFINPTAALRTRLQEAKADLYDPAWAEWYHVADRSDAAVVRFLADWVRRNYELIDKYQPDMLWFDNGANGRDLDPLKLDVAAYYYNRARQWDKEVAISTKYVAYAPSGDDTKQVGSIIDFEKVGTRSPAGIRPAPWQVDDAIGSTWGYTTGMTVSGPAAILNRLVDTVSKDGNYLLNISPMADGTIPQAQQDTLLAIGGWLDQNGEAIYGTRAWTKFGEGAGRNALRFTTKGNTLYAIAQTLPDNQLVIASLAKGQVSAAGPIKVEMLGRTGALEATQDERGLAIKLPADRSGNYAWVFKIIGFSLAPSANPAGQP